MAPLVVITGPTASGKTSLAIELAERFGGEIVCADSRTIYKGMDIGTAKPTADERARVPHHLLDVVEPGERYTAADFQRDTYRAIESIRRRGKVPFLVGGTGLYIDSVVLEYIWPEQSLQDTQQQVLQSKTLDELQAMIKNQHLAMPVNDKNKRHLISTLSRSGSGGQARTSPRDNTYVVAITTDKEILNKRIRMRAEQMFQQGVVDETKQLARKYGWDNEAMKSNIYPIVRQVIEGTHTENEATELFVRKDRQLAKRQITWLRRREYIEWLSLEQARSYIETKLG